MVNVPAMGSLIVEGSGDPEGEDFQEVVNVVYGVAYSIKHLPQMGEMPVNYTPFVVPPSEAQYFSVSGTMDNAPREDVRWRILIPQPRFVTDAVVHRAMSELREQCDPPGLERVSFKMVEEGPSAQTLHVGPYERMGEATGLLREHFQTNSLEMNGDHHEIYLSDPKKTSPDKLRTIVRWPYRGI